MKISQSTPSISVIVLMAMMLLSTSHLVSAQEVVPTRGIGLYPGDPNEYFAPSSDYSLGDDPIACYNIALYRAAWASSTRDYNHTAHLVTDGIIVF